MRSTDEQLQEILQRSDVIQKDRILRGRIAADLTATAVCLVLLVSAARYLPVLRTVEEQTEAAQYGSLLLLTAGTGYVVVGILAFALGVFVTLLCLHLKERAGTGR